MKANKLIQITALRFARGYGFAKVVFAGAYKNGFAFSAQSQDFEETYYGYPNFVIVSKAKKCRFATPTEALDILSTLH